MYKLLYIFTIGLLLSLLASCWVPKRLGKVKKITTENITKYDSVFMFPVAFTYRSYLNNSYRHGEPDANDLAYEKHWDSIQYDILQKHFQVERVDIGPKDDVFRKRPFKFRVLLGGTEFARSNWVDYNLSLFTWNVRAGKMDKAYTSLFDTLQKLSFIKPLVIITNRFYFFYVNFQAGFAEGGTGIRNILDFHIVILSKGEIIYYRNYSNDYSHHRLERKPHLKEKIAHKLFDKLE